MKFNMIYSMICLLYAKAWRDVLIEAVDDPDEVWDDALLASIDALLGYVPTPGQ